MFEDYLEIEKWITNYDKEKLNFDNYSFLEDKIYFLVENFCILFKIRPFSHDSYIILIQDLFNKLNNNILFKHILLYEGIKKNPLMIYKLNRINFFDPNEINESKSHNRYLNFYFTDIFEKNIYLGEFFNLIKNTFNNQEDFNYPYFLKSFSKNNFQLFYEIIDGIYELLAGWHSLGFQQKWLQHDFRYCPKRIHIKGRMSVILLFCENFLEHKGQTSIGEVVTMC